MNTDTYLDDIALKTFSWKNEKMLAACLLITEQSIKQIVFWPDLITFDDLGSDDRNVIGNAWRMVTRLKLIEKTGSWRRSTAGPCKGRVIWEYRLVNRGLAEAFLRRYQPEKAAQVQQQVEMAL